MDAELRYDEILRVLSRHEVEFILVGGLAAIVQGSPLMTEDVDIVYARSEVNHERLAGALKELGAYYYDPAGRHIEPDVPRLASLRMHLLLTNCGRLDVLTTVGDGLTYDDLREKSREHDIEDFLVRVLDIDTLIETKEYAGRPKDQHGLLFLRQLRHEIQRLEDEPT